MNENINLTKILKNCPRGFRLYSSVYGEVKFIQINKNRDWRIEVDFFGKSTYFSEEGKLGWNLGWNYTTGECVLFPSKGQRDWSKFTAPWYKKERFGPKTLNAFDRIIVRDDSERWLCTIFSYIGEDHYPYNTSSGNYAHCIPYNDETKHLVGTTEEAPEYYRCWEV